MNRWSYWDGGGEWEESANIFVVAIGTWTCLKEVLEQWQLLSSGDTMCFIEISTRWGGCVLSSGYCTLFNCSGGDCNVVWVNLFVCAFDGGGPHPLLHENKAFLAKVHRGKALVSLFLVPLLRPWQNSPKTNSFLFLLQFTTDLESFLRVLAVWIVFLSLLFPDPSPQAFLCPGLPLNVVCISLLNFHSWWPKLFPGYLFKPWTSVVV